MKFIGESLFGVKLISGMKNAAKDVMMQLMK